MWFIVFAFITLSIAPDGSHVFNEELVWRQSPVDTSFTRIRTAPVVQYVPHDECEPTTKQGASER